MLIDAHIHTSGMSDCSLRSPMEIIAQCIVDHTDGIVLANHCNRGYSKDIGYAEWCKRYNEEFYLTRDAGKKYNKKVFFGVEVETTAVKKVHYVIYGMTPEDLLNSPELYLLNQKELFEYCVSNNFALVQAHPYRNQCVPQDPAYLHGVEISCHPLYKTTMAEEVRAFAKENDLFLTCGSDFHGDTYKPRCGIYIPDDIDTEQEFKEYICSHQVALEVCEIVNTEYGEYHSWR